MTEPDTQYTADMHPAARAAAAEERRSTRRDSIRNLLDRAGRGIPLGASEAELLRNQVEAEMRESEGERDRAQRAEAERYGAYRERAHLVAHLAALRPSHIGRTDPNAPDWPVLIIETPAGQMSWHIAERDLDLFGHVPPTGPEHRGWDGHTTEEKYVRLRALTAAAPGPDTAATQATDGWEQQDDGTWTLPFAGGIVTAPATLSAEEWAQFAAAWAQRRNESTSGPAMSAGQNLTLTGTLAEPPLAISHDMATTLHRTLGQLLGDQDAQAIARIRDLHFEEYGSCRECTGVFSVAWPCPTIRALDQPKGPTP